MIHITYLDISPIKLSLVSLEFASEFSKLVNISAQIVDKLESSDSLFCHLSNLSHFAQLLLITYRFHSFSLSLFLRVTFPPVSLFAFLIFPFVASPLLEFTCSSFFQLSLTFPPPLSIFLSIVRSLWESDINYDPHDALADESPLRVQISKSWYFLCQQLTTRNHVYTQNRRRVQRNVKGANDGRGCCKLPRSTSKLSFFFLSLFSFSFFLLFFFEIRCLRSFTFSFSTVRFVAP